MNAAEMPTQVEAVVCTLHDVAQAHAAEISRLPDELAAAMDWQMSAEQHAQVTVLARVLGLKARMLEFTLEGLAGVVASQVDEDRTLYAQMASLVDLCRVAGADPLDGPAPAPATKELADRVIGRLADVQLVLRWRFPGEETLGA